MRKKGGGATPQEKNIIIKWFGPDSVVLPGENIIKSAGAIELLKNMSAYDVDHGMAKYNLRSGWDGTESKSVQIIQLFLTDLIKLYDFICNHLRGTAMGVNESSAMEIDDSRSGGSSPDQEAYAEFEKKYGFDENAQKKFLDNLHKEYVQLTGAAEICPFPTTHIKDIMLRVVTIFNQLTKTITGYGSQVGNLNPAPQFTATPWQRVDDTPYVDQRNIQQIRENIQYTITINWKEGEYVGQATNPLLEMLIKKYYKNFSQDQILNELNTTDKIDNLRVLEKQIIEILSSSEWENLRWENYVKEQCGDSQPCREYKEQHEKARFFGNYDEQYTNDPILLRPREGGPKFGTRSLQAGQKKSKKRNNSKKNTKRRNNKKEQLKRHNRKKTANKKGAGKVRQNKKRNSKKTLKK